MYQILSSQREHSNGMYQFCQVIENTGTECIKFCQVSENTGTECINFVKSVRTLERNVSILSSQ
jgi:hypothetical protein